MIDDPLVHVAGALRCPVCGSPMEVGAAGAWCASGHRFDRARQGYLTLFGSAGRRFPGDTGVQVAARDRVLEAGLLAPVAEAVRSAAVAGVTDPAEGPLVVEVGAGTGYYLAGVLDAVAARLPGAAGIGTDISVAAARRLARRHPRLAALVCDTWDGLPLADGRADVLLDVFAPRNAAEFARVLRPGGTLVVVTPGPEHLEPLRTEAGMLTPGAGKTERIAADLGGGFEQVGVRRVDEEVTVPAERAADLALMGPSGAHLEAAAVHDRLSARDRRVRIQVDVTTLRRLPLQE